MNIPTLASHWPVWAYDVVYADPPWQYADKCNNRGGAVRHYPTMSDEEIARLPVVNLAAPDSVCFLWITPPKLDVGMKVLRQWGFVFKSFGFVWVKCNQDCDIDIDAPGQGLAIGMGHHTRANAEPCLLGVRGKGIKRVDAGIRQTQIHPRGAHSAKPVAFRRDLEKLYGPQRRVELFAREQVPSWDSWGLDVQGAA